MCGIAGILGGESTVNEELLWSMAEKLAHRGPDDSGVLVRQGVGLAHTRLSLLDLSSHGHQPWEDGEHALVYNGEIYNFAEERRLLEEEGATFVSTSDTEVLFHSLVRRGVEETLRRIRGMYAFVFCNLKRRTAVMARDRFGIKPLYYAPLGDRTVFGSEIKAIAEAVPLKLHDVSTLYSVMGVADQSNWRTVFEGVVQVPPGHYVEVVDGACGPAIPYFELHREIDRDYYQELDGCSGEEVANRLFDLVEQAVERVMVSDAKLGAFVSGGVDSALVAALGARDAPQGFCLYTANVLGRFSELSDALLLANHLDLPLEKADFAPEQFLSDLARCTWHYEAPMVKHTNSVAFAAVARVASADGAKAVLTGEAADELFLGYPQMLVQRYRPVLTAPMRILSWIYDRIPGMASYVLEEGERATQRFLGMAVLGYERQVLREEGLDGYEFLPPRERLRHYETIQAVREVLLSILHRNDRMGMLASLEARFAYLDEDLVRFAVNLPVRRKIAMVPRLHNWRHPFLTDKRVLREASEKVLPRRISRKVKVGFPTHGLSEVEVKSGTFSGSFVAELLRLDSSAERYLLEHAPRYEIAKLFAVEVFARLFAGSEDVEDVADWVQRTAWMTVES